MASYTPAKTTDATHAPAFQKIPARRPADCGLADCHGFGVLVVPGALYPPVRRPHGAVLGRPTAPARRAGRAGADPPGAFLGPGLPLQRRQPAAPGRADRPLCRPGRGEI